MSFIYSYHTIIFINIIITIQMTTKIIIWSFFKSENYYDYMYIVQGIYDMEKMNMLPKCDLQSNS